MYDTAPRDWSVKPTTGELLGPTTYVLCNPRPKKQNAAPFLSTLKRKPAFLNKIETEALYDTRAKINIKGGTSSLKSKSKRFVYKADDNPPPTKYNPYLPKQKKVLRLDPTKPKLYVCNVPHSLTVTAPSVPSHNDAAGYDIDDRGDIVKVPPSKPIVPPLDYRHLWKLDKGCAWASRTTKRFNSKIDLDHPGPTCYDVQMPKCKRYEADEEFREMARLFSFVPRYIEAQEIKGQKERLPGPGSYNIDSGSLLKPQSKSVKPLPFISGTKRFHDTTATSPSPNQYKIVDSQKRRQFSFKRPPFGFDSPRFHKDKEHPSPGPAAYSLRGAIEEKTKKKQFALFHPPFNNTEERSCDFTTRDSRCMPSPADYPEVKLDDEWGESNRDDLNGKITASVFKSDVERFTPIPEDALGPATYNVSASFNKNQNRKSYHTGMVPFNFSGRRNTLPVVHLDVPCPTTYETELGLKDNGYHFNTTPRWPYEGDETPGPTTYKLHAAVKDSFYKAANTHNLRLKENVLGKKLRLAPKQTRNKYVNTLKRRKKLKFFDVEMDYEDKQMILIEILFSSPI